MSKFYVIPEHVNALNYHTELIINLDQIQCVSRNGHDIIIKMVERSITLDGNPDELDEAYVNLRKELIG